MLASPIPFIKCMIGRCEDDTFESLISSKMVYLTPEEFYYTAMFMDSLNHSNKDFSRLYIRARIGILFLYKTSLKNLDKVNRELI